MIGSLRKQFLRQLCQTKCLTETVTSHLRYEDTRSVERRGRMFVQLVRLFRQCSTPYVQLEFVSNKQNPYFPHLRNQNFHPVYTWFELIGRMCFQKPIAMRNTNKLRQATNYIHHNFNITISFIHFLPLTCQNS